VVDHLGLYRHRPGLSQLVDDAEAVMVAVLLPGRPAASVPAAQQAGATGVLAMCKRDVLCVCGVQQAGWLVGQPSRQAGWT